MKSRHFVPTARHSVLLALTLFTAGSAVAYSEDASGITPEVIRDALSSLPEQPTGEDFYRSLDQYLWEVYQADPDVEHRLERYLVEKERGPGIALSAIGLIPFRKPEHALLMADRALEEEITNFTRWYLINAAPYVLSMGDVWHRDGGVLDAKSRAFIERLQEMARKASELDVGTFHAQTLLELYDQERYPPGESGELGLARWHVSAYLIGTLDLQDYPLLEPIIDPAQGPVWMNLVEAVGYQANRDFVAHLRDKKRSEISREQEQQAAKEIKTWWKTYLKSHPDGDWRPAVASGFRKAGYSIRFEDDSQVNMDELVRALRSDNDIHVYNAARVLNDIHETRFDVERIFLGRKYAAGPFDPFRKMEKLQGDLVRYWESRVGSE